MPNEPEYHPKELFVKDLRPKDRTQITLLIKSKDLLFAKDGKPYLSMMLSDRTGAIDARLWDNAETHAQNLSEGQIIAIWGRVHNFQNRLQIVVENLVPVPANEAKLEDFVPHVEANLDALYQDLIGIFERVKNPFVRQLALSLLNDPEIAPRYKRCPAAKTIHHAFIGGLLTHSLQLLHLVDAIAPLYPQMDRDILAFGAAFHDFGKIFELSYDSTFGYTDEGKLVGHITVGTILVDRHIRLIKDFPQDLEFHLKHLILSHHGRLEYGSPKRPATLEAEVLHMVDSMDSKIESITTFIQGDQNTGRWTGYHKAYDQYYFKPQAQ